MSDSIVITGIATVLPSPDSPSTTQVDPTPFLEVRKSRKYLSPQDDLAVVSAANALEKANMTKGHIRDNADRVALAMCVGYLSFDRKDTNPVLAVSVEDERFSMKRFSSEGMRKTHPLLTFRCLPNMPAFHVSVNFGAQGPYFCTYPGPAQTYAAIERARRWILDGEADVALVGAVAHQRNFLVEHHLGRVPHGTPKELLRDAGAMIVLERESAARARSAPPLAVLRALTRSMVPTLVYAPSTVRPQSAWYRPEDPDVFDSEPFDLGCASPLVSLAQRIADGRTGKVTHTLLTRELLQINASWELLG